MDMDKKKLALVVPCFNEEDSLKDNIEIFKKRLFYLMEKNLVTDDSFICFVDDGSKDGTWELIENAHNSDPEHIKAIKFTKNYGNQKALISGLEYAHKQSVGFAVTIDADLQQDESKIEEFIRKYNEGVHIVYGVRKDRKTDNFFKKLTSNAFYKFMELMGANIVPNHSEYRLMSKKALDILIQYPERNLFLRGIFFDTGLKSEIVEFDVKKRKYGKSKFNYSSLLKLAASGITSFSVRPLRIIFYIGILISFISICWGIWTATRLFYDLPARIGNIDYYEIFEMFMSGLQMLCIGIIGEYVGQILQEVKGRPRAIIEKQLD